MAGRMKILPLPELVLVHGTVDGENASLSGVLASGVLCHVTVRRDGGEALDYLLDEGVAPPALILLEYNLPTVSGLEVLARIRLHPRTWLVPVVMFGGVDEKKTWAESYRLGANSCVPKPESVEEHERRLAHIARYWLKTNLALDRPCRPPPALFARGD